MLSTENKLRKRRNNTFYHIQNALNTSLRPGDLQRQYIASYARLKSNWISPNSNLA